MNRTTYRRSKSEWDFSSTLYTLESLLNERCKETGKTSFVYRPDGHFEEDENKSRVESEGYWPNCDTSVWLRSCDQEVFEPIRGDISGAIPKWLKGTLLRNGPGSLKVGEYTFNHLFDSSALLHRFEIAQGKVTYQRRFVQTDVYKKNKAAQRIVVTEFGTAMVPDPCQTIFQRIAAVFTTDEASDNSMISVYPFGDEYYTFSEAAIIHRIDPKTLETKSKVNISDYVNIVNHTSHPHVANDGTVYNVGLSVTARGPAYNVVCFSPSFVAIDEFGEERELSMFDQASIVASVPARWILNPSYMHTFGITENYFVIVEQPLAVSLTSVMASKIRRQAMMASLKWHENENTFIHVVSRETGQVERTFVAEGFFFLHIINQFETRDRNYMVLDICCYRDAKMLDCMYVETMKNIHKNPDYPTLFRGRPLRFVLPMKQPMDDMPPEYNLITVETVNQSAESFREFEDDIDGDEEAKTAFGMPSASASTKNEWEYKEDLLRKRATARRLLDGNIFVTPELLCDLGCETPRLNYDSYLGTEYRYFYAISSDVDIEHPGTLIKVDILTKSKKVWSEKDIYPSEPIFVADPNGKKEDDGVLLSALVWGEGYETKVGLLILDAATFTEIARATFETPGPTPKCLHGWFSMDK